MSEFGRLIRYFYAQLSDLDLDATVNEIIREIPNFGCKRMTGTFSWVQFTSSASEH